MSLIKPSNFDGVYIPNPDFISQGIKNWIPYKGSAVQVPFNEVYTDPNFVSIKSTNTDALVGSHSGVITKTSGNALGEGLYTEFYVDKGLRNQPLQLSFLYKSLGTYNNDIKIYIYDTVNNITLFPQLSDLSVSPSSSIYSTLIYLNDTCEKYRLYFHVATSSLDAFQIQINNIEIKKHELPVGSIIGNWTEFTPIIGATTTAPTFGTVTFHKAWWRRVGSNMEIQWVFVQSNSGTAGNGVYLFYLPSGFNIDSSKFPTTTSNIADNAFGLMSSGQASSLSNGNSFGLSAQYHPSFNNAIRLSLDDHGTTYSTNRVLSSSTWTFATAIRELSFSVSIPISGWSSNVNLITDFTEYASNSSSTNADDTTSFVYGPEGSTGILKTTLLSATRKKRVRFKNPIKETDILTIQFLVDGKWFDTDQAPIYLSTDYFSCPAILRVSTGETAGIGLSPVSNSNTDIDVLFGKNVIAEYAGAVAGWNSASLTATKWRVKKISNSNMAEFNPTGIYESGSNANGSYVKYVDGTMECWHKVTLPGQAISTDISTTWNFPQPFVSEPNITIFARGQNGTGSADMIGLQAYNGLYGTASNTTWKLSTYSYRAATNSSGNTVTYYVRAIGKWNNALTVYKPGTLVGVTIEESGSNSNGTYIKYSDGTMICYHNNISSGATITFPFAFIEIPSIVHELIDTTSTSTLQYTFRSTKNRTTTSFSFGIGGAGSASYMAIGRWK